MTLLTLLRPSTAGGVAGLSYRDEVAADSPTRQYLLDDTSGTAAVDNIGGTSGTYNGSPTLVATSLIASGGGTAVAFAAASSQYLVLPIAFAANAALSLEIWFKWTSGTAIVRDNTSSAGTIFGFDNGGTFTVRIAGGTLSTSKTTAQVQDGNTHHLVVTRVAGTSRQTEVYLDGVSIASGLTGSGANTTDLRVARNGSIVAFSDLTADEIAFYSSVLSATRVAAHYSAGTAAAGGVALVGTVAATSSLTGDLTVQAGLAGTVAATSSLTGNLTVPIPVAGTIAATSSVTGALTVTGPLAGTVAGTSTLTGALTVRAALAGTVAATSVLTGTLTNTPPGGVALAGTIAATSVLTGALTVRAALAGTVAATSALTGTLTVTTTGTNALAGTIVSASTLTGTLSVSKPLAGTLAATSAVTGNLTARAVLTGTLAGSSILTGAVTVAHPLAGTLAAASALTGAITVARPLAGVITVSSVLTGALTNVGPIEAVGRLEAVLAASFVEGADAVTTGEGSGTATGSESSSGLLALIE